MKIKVFTENPLTAFELRKIRDVVRDSSNRHNDFLAVLPARYKRMEEPNKRMVKVWLDNSASYSHEYQTSYPDK